MKRVSLTIEGYNLVGVKSQTDEGGLSMKKLVIFLLVILFFSILSFSDVDRFKLNFTDSYLVYAPGNNILQITANLRVLSYGFDWTVKKVYPYLYHLKLNTWQGFFWMVNTSRQEAYVVRNGTFGNIGGQQTRLNVNVEVIGGSTQTPPDRFLLHFNDAYLIFVRSSQTLQIIADNMVLSYGTDWLKAEVYPYLFHIKYGMWQTFYWQVNTSRKEVYEVRNGTFGNVIGGTSTNMNIPVTVY